VNSGLLGHECTISQTPETSSSHKVRYHTESFSLELGTEQLVSDVRLHGNTFVAIETTLDEDLFRSDCSFIHSFIHSEYFE
jgi:hypothetical protein